MGIPDAVLDAFRKANEEGAPAKASRRQITGWFTADVVRQLQQLALDTDTNVQGMMVEAFNDLFAKHRKPRIAR
jgi:hypothetical protein